jgi:replication factor C subunit 1
MAHPVPFMKASSVTAPKKLAKEVPNLEEVIEEEDNLAEAVDVDEEEEELDLKTDKYIKQPKAKGSKKTAKKPGKADKNEDDDEDGGTAPKAEGKGAKRGRGRPKKS